MSQRRLEMEQMQADRWLALQARVEAVQRRRQQRLLEMQRRLEMAKAARKRQPQPQAPVEQHEDGEVVEEGRQGGGGVDRAAGGGESGGSSSRPAKERGGGVKGSKGRGKRAGNGHGGGGGSSSSSSKNKAEEDDEEQELLALTRAALGGEAAARGASPSLLKALSGLPPDALSLRAKLLHGAAAAAAAAAAAPLAEDGARSASAAASAASSDSAPTRRLEALLQELRACLPKDWGATGGMSGKRRRRKKGASSSSSSSSSSIGATAAGGGDATLAANAAVLPLTLPVWPVDVPLESLRALAQLLEAHKGDALLRHLAAAPGALPVLVHLATPGALRQGADGAAPSLVLHTLHLALHDAECRDRLLASAGGGAALVDAVLCYAAAATEQAKGKALPPALAACLSSSLSCLTLLVRHVVASPGALLPVQMDLVRYLLAAGVVTQLGELLGFLRTGLVSASSASAKDMVGGSSNSSGTATTSSSAGGKGKKGKRGGNGKGNQCGEEQEGMMRLLGKALSLLEAVAGFPASGAANHGAAASLAAPETQAQAEPRGEVIYESEMPRQQGEGDDTAVSALRPAHPLCAPVMAAFAAAPSLANGLPTLSALLDEGRERPDDLAAALPVAWLVLRTLNHLARLDLRRLQALLGSDALHSYWTFTHSLLLRQLTARLGAAAAAAAGSGGKGESIEVEGCLEQLLVLLGYSFLLRQQPPYEQQGEEEEEEEEEEGGGGSGKGSDAHRQLQQQMSPLLLTRLATLPFKYWSSEVHKDVLFPTLLSLCHRCPASKALLAKEIHPELLITYLEERQIQRSLAADGPAPYPPPKAAGAGGGGKPEPLPAWKLLALRFPPVCWADAVRFFRE